MRLIKNKIEISKIYFVVLHFFGGIGLFFVLFLTYIIIELKI